MSAKADLEKLFKHMRAWHRYEPRDWLGQDWDELTETQRFIEYRSVHAREHREWEDYYDPKEWVILHHPVGSRDAKLQTKVKMMNDREDTRDWKA